MTNTRNREDHIEWCKQRAREYLERGELVDAVGSMLSDMTKHTETNTELLPMMGLVGMQAAGNGDHNGVSRFIEGFN